MGIITKTEPSHEESHQEKFRQHLKMYENQKEVGPEIFQKEPCHEE